MLAPLAGEPYRVWDSLGYRLLDAWRLGIFGSLGCRASGYQFLVQGLTINVGSTCWGAGINGAGFGVTGVAGFLDSR